jgi:hypothetical protein
MLLYTSDFFVASKAPPDRGFMETSLPEISKIQSDNEALKRLHSTSVESQMSSV